jgi:S1-C subfamily serine protease
MTDTAKAALPDFSGQLTRLVESVSQSLVEVRGRRGTLGSGFVWRPGLVVTAEEVLGEPVSLSVAIAGQNFEAELAGRDPSTGIAVLRAGGLASPALSLTPGHATKTGEIALVTGRREQGVTARLGIVSLSGGAWRSMRGGHIDSLIRLDVTLDRRGEGAAVIDSEGRVFGMALRGPRRTVLAIPAATIERIAAHISENGSVRPGYLGLGLHPVRVKGADADPGYGLIVLGVATGGPGEAAGILQGDIVTAWNGEALTGLRNLFRKLSPDSVGQTVELGLLRAGQPLPVKCVVGARPEA